MQPMLDPGFKKANEEFEAYLEYNKVLRAWFVAFGVGGPALFLIYQPVGARLSENGQLQAVAAMFLIGAGSQVLGAMLNKIGNWYVYRGSFDAAYRGTRRFSFFHWLVQQFWLDIVLDLTTIVLFGWATWRMLTVFGTSTPGSGPAG
jgi:hypothetical protein